MNPDVEKTTDKTEKTAVSSRYIRTIREEADKDLTYVQRDTSLQDFYVKNNPFEVSNLDKKEYQEFLKGLSADEKKILEKGDNYYEITFKNAGGLPMPVIVEFEYVDNTKEIFRIPAEIWRYNADKVSKIFPTSKEIKQITLDPNLETADIDTNNNYYPPKPQATRFQLFKQKQNPENPMQRDKRNKEMK